MDVWQERQTPVNVSAADVSFEADFCHFRPIFGFQLKLFMLFSYMICVSVSFVGVYQLSRGNRVRNYLFYASAKW